MSSSKDSIKMKKKTFFQTDDSWLFSQGSWSFPDPNSMSKYSKSRFDSNAGEETHLFDNDVCQPLLSKKKRFLFFNFSPRCLIISATLSTVCIAIGIMTMIPCMTSEAFNTVFKVSDTKSGIPILPGQAAREALYSNKTFNIALLGDSLINKPYKMFALVDKISAYLPGYKLNLVNCGSNGAQINFILSDLIPNCVLPMQADAILMLWDSDVSDIDEDDLNIVQKTELRSAYQLNLISAVDQLVKTGAYVAMAGPGILGEGAKWYSPDEERFFEKEPMLNAYRIINKQVSASFNIPYIDVRQAFLDYVPSYQLCYSLCVTFDGEHENERGTVIVSKLFAASLSNWLIGYNK